MNKQRREKLNNDLILLRQILSNVEQAADKEQDCVDNCPENLQMSERYDAMEEAAELLAEAVTALEEAVENISRAIGR